MIDAEELERLTMATDNGAKSPTATPKISQPRKSLAWWIFKQVFAFLIAFGAVLGFGLFIFQLFKE